MYHHNLCRSSAGGHTSTSTLLAHTSHSRTELKTTDVHRRRTFSVYDWRSRAFATTLHIINMIIKPTGQWSFRISPFVSLHRPLLTSSIEISHLSFWVKPETLSKLSRINRHDLKVTSSRKLYSCILESFITDQSNNYSLFEMTIADWISRMLIFCMCNRLRGRRCTQCFFRLFWYGLRANLHAFCCIDFN